MADKNNSGDKTEKPTPKRLKDARKKGDVSKSKDVTSTAGMILWTALLGIASIYFAERLSGFLIQTLRAVERPEDFIYTLQQLGNEAFVTFLQLSLLLFIPTAFFGLVVEFLQAGPVITSEKIKPKMEHLNPASGLKRMFSMDNLVEVAKSIAKTILLFVIGWLILKSYLPELTKLPRSISYHIGMTLWEMILLLFFWTVAIFSLVALLDAVYQRYSFLKKMRMSIRDIKQEHKEEEGDPLVKQQRRQAHHEWAQQSAMDAARQANVMVVNPTHLAIALDYDREKIPVPTVSAKGEDVVARAMREAAEEGHVPILRNVELAHMLYADVDEGDIISSDLFEVVAEVILWAKHVREQINGEAGEVSTEKFEPPGEDLTRYPETEGIGGAHG